CPYCGETIDLLIDESEAEQNYIEDCQVCCQPIVVDITINSAGELSLILRSENE
ncbi:MAG: CPXCG motif-containing cysteine-rich protein, partial [Methyloprofundus sp.]|nr:CPXCG motif-containing cysteine-rich protein [Methyloprofundus sp.]